MRLSRAILVNGYAVVGVDESVSRWRDAVKPGHDPWIGVEP